MKLQLLKKLPVVLRSLKLRGAKNDFYRENRVIILHYTNFNLPCNRIIEGVMVIVKVCFTQKVLVKCGIDI